MAKTACNLNTNTSVLVPGQKGKGYVDNNARAAKGHTPNQYFMLFTLNTASY